MPTSIYFHETARVNVSRPIIRKGTMWRDIEFIDTDGNELSISVFAADGAPFPVAIEPDETLTAARRIVSLMLTETTAPWYADETDEQANALRVLLSATAETEPEPDKGE